MHRFVSWSIVLLVLASVSSTPTFGQTQPASSAGLELLSRVSKKYADAKSYFIESVEERTSSNEYRHYWSKTILTAAESPGDRFYYKGQSEMGSAVRVSDGKTVWTYRVDRNKYTAKPVGEKSDESKMISMSEIAMNRAEYLRKELGRLSKPLKSAERLPDANVKIKGHKVACMVVRVRSADEKRPSPGFAFEKNIWIDKKTSMVVRIVEHADAHMIGASAPTHEEAVTTFFSELDRKVPDGLFIFVPPADAKLIRDFPDPMAENNGYTLAGEQVPPLKLKSADGKVTPLESFRGKPVLIDFWATWCAPCVEALPELAKIYEETKDKGLELVSVDRDEEAKTASDFFAKKGYAWPDFHDGGDIEKLIGGSGIPRIMLVDGGGKVVYDGSADDDSLRGEIAKLGPEYVSLKPKPKENPCDSVKAAALQTK
jgi:thiol-disulfide isomerase/thioredoxin